MSEQASRRTSLDQFPEVMTIADVAEYIGKSVKRVYAIARTGTWDDCLVLGLDRKVFDRERIRLWREGKWSALRGSRLKRAS